MNRLGLAVASTALATLSTLAALVALQGSGEAELPQPTAEQVTAAVAYANAAADAVNGPEAGAAVTRP
jgi:hypothetical protein